VSHGLRKKVDEMKAAEEPLGWEVTMIRNLEPIIIINWDRV
jgi:hypothetical protein